MESISVYIHIPFCVRKCAYCDFTSFAGAASRAEEYVQAVCREMRAQAAFFGRRRVGTVFLGGGTPTLLSGAQIKALLDCLRDSFDVAGDAEITMEGNPGTLTCENLAQYRAAGVNRLSLGVQSLDDGLLCAIGRIHTAAEAVQAVKMAREAGFDNLNLDLMLGLPGQTAAQWERTLTQAVRLGPEHLSCYSLIIEEGTPLCEDVRLGRCAPLPDEDALERMDGITEHLTREAGFTRYEVSNYARPGRECRHNIVYWECRPYLGLGCAAHSDMDGYRFYNSANWAEYMRAVDRAASLGVREGHAQAMPFTGAMLSAQEGSGDARERMFERMMMGLRMVRGVDASRFERDFGLTPEQAWPKSIAQLKAGGMLERAGERLHLTPRGMQVMNGVLVTLLEE